VPWKEPGNDVLQRRRAVPIALIVGEEAIAVGVETDSAGRAHAGGGGDDFSLGSDAQHPAAPGHGARAGVGEAERGPDVAVAVGTGAEGVFVEIARDAELIGDDLEFVGAVIAVGVAHARDAVALGDVEPAVLKEHAQRLVQSGREERETRLGEVVAERALDEPEFAATGGDDEPAVGEQIDAAALEDHVGGKWIRRDLVVFAFARDVRVVGRGGDAVNGLGRFGGECEGGGREAAGGEEERGKAGRHGGRKRLSARGRRLFRTWRASGNRA